MTKSEKPAKKIRGPYLAAAVYCQTIVSESEGRVTPVNIFDSINLTIPAGTPPNFPSEENRIHIPVWSFISFRSGDAPGEHNFYIVAESPSGKKQKQEEQVIKLPEGAHAGANLNIKITMGIFKGGLFWTNVYLDNKLMTRMPLLINVKREGETKSVVDAPKDVGKKKEKTEAK
jgi:hypothetical protein